MSEYYVLTDLSVKFKDDLGSLFHQLRLEWLVKTLLNRQWKTTWKFFRSVVIFVFESPRNETARDADYKILDLIQKPTCCNYMCTDFKDSKWTPRISQVGIPWNYVRVGWLLSSQFYIKRHYRKWSAINVMRRRIKVQMLLMHQKCFYIGTMTVVREKEVVAVQPVLTPNASNTAAWSVAQRSCLWTEVPL